MLISYYLYKLQLCARRQVPLTAKNLHAQIIKTGLDQCDPLPNSLLDVYGKCRLVQDALHMFDQMPRRDLVSWASILTALNQANLPHLSLSMLPTMLRHDGLEPDHFVLATLFKACARLDAIRQGKQVHARFLLSPFRDDSVVNSSLIDMYVKCGLPDHARAVFNSISLKNSVPWTAMISGYARSERKLSGSGVDAFHLFIEMRREGVDIVDPLVLSSTIGASANLAALELGRQIHGLVISLGYESCIFISNALVDMYAKCSDILAANEIFGSMQRRDVVSWTSIIVGVAQHGQAEEALALYDEMISAGVKPNEVTFVGLICACSHVGLVSKGRQLFKSMIEDYGISPSLQHYTCFLDLLSRSGHLDEAENLINAMPFKPDEPTWAALLGACTHHNNIEMGIRVADHLLSLKPEDPSTYILLSNIYAGAALWEKVSKVRKLMAVMEIKKQPGHSCIGFGKER